MNHNLWNAIILFAYFISHSTIKTIFVRFDIDDFVFIFTVQVISCAFIICIGCIGARVVDDDDDDENDDDEGLFFTC